MSVEERLARIEQNQQQIISWINNTQKATLTPLINVVNSHTQKLKTLNAQPTTTPETTSAVQSAKDAETTP
jgi:hypothetical protein